MAQILNATRPLEYVAFLNIKINTKEGFAFVFFGIDAYTDIAFNLGVERDDSPISFLKNIYMLTEHQEFKELNKDGFTLVLEDHENLGDKIDEIIKSVNGSAIFNKTYNNYISNPFLAEMSAHFKKMGL